MWRAGCTGDFWRVSHFGVALGFPFLGAGSVGWIPAPVIVVVLFCVVFHVFLTRTTVGRDIYAIGGNPQAALLSGVPVDARLILVYALSGVTAAAGAIVLAGRMNSAFRWPAWAASWIRLRR